MNNQRIITTIVSAFRRQLQRNLYAIVSVGTMTAADFYPGWSDIDLLIVVNTLNLETKQWVAKTKNRLERLMGVPIGLYVITRKESLRPLHPDIAFDGKTLQALFELRRWPNRQWYPRRHVQWYVPSEKIMRVMSVANIFFFVRRNRHSLSSNVLPRNTSALRKIVAKELKACFIVTKLALQSQGVLVPENKRDMISLAKTQFPKHSFHILIDGLRLIPDWNKIRSHRTLITLLSQLDTFLETFPVYASKSPR